MKEVEVLSELLDRSISESVGDSGQVAVLFSGGLDSSVIVHLAKRHTNPVLYTCGLKDSHDIRKASEASRLIDLPLHEVIIEEQEVLDAIPKACKLLSTRDPAKVTIALPLYLTMKEVDEKIALCGQGADELFGGYARYTKMDGEKLAKSIAGDFEELLCTDVKGWLNIGSHFSKDIRFPYLNKEVVNFALHLPVGFKVSGNDRKIILRFVAERMGLPENLSGAPKKAAQFSSGIAPLIKKIAKSKGQTLREFFGTFGD